MESVSTFPYRTPSAHGSKGLRIENRAYYSTSPAQLGRQIPLADIEEWARYPDEITYPGMDKMDFGFYKNPLKNRIDGTALWRVDLFRHCSRQDP